MLLASVLGDILNYFGLSEGTLLSWVSLVLVLACGVVVAGYILFVLAYFVAKAVSLAWITTQRQHRRSRLLSKEEEEGRKYYGCEENWFQGEETDSKKGSSKSKDFTQQQ